MIRSIFFFLIVLISVFSVSCRSTGDETKPDKTNKKSLITVSIPPQQYFVRQIAGSHFEINVMIPPGSNPVTYDPSPEKMKKVANSLVYIKMGHLAFEQSWMPKFKSVNPDLKIIDQSKYTELIKGRKVKKMHSHASGVDPHIWTSPKAVRNQVKAIKEGLAEIDTAHSADYEKNYRNFLSKLNTLDASVHKRLSALENKSFMIFHPALSYYARDYGLEQIPIETEGKEPTPAELRDIVELARKKDIETIFIQKQFNTDNAETIAKEIEAEVEVIYPLDSNWVHAINDITAKLVSRNMKKSKKKQKNGKIN
jgi:zinc transport system substrate-binding protein